MRVFCDATARPVTLAHPPVRIVSLVSSATEALFALGLGDRVVGVSSYCSRYVPNLSVPVVGDYLRVDEEALARLSPDLILTTSGIQRGLARRLAEAGQPVYALPLPASIHGVLEDLMLLGGLVGRLGAARDLANEWYSALIALRSAPPARAARTFVEIWFGAHQRTVGGLSFITDLLEAAGLRGIYADEPLAYPAIDLADVDRRAPERWVLFSEPEHPVDPAALAEERGWTGADIARTVIVSTVDRGRNIIHDGPSMVETARWLHSLATRR